MRVGGPPGGELSRPCSCGGGRHCGGRRQSDVGRGRPDPCTAMCLRTQQALSVARRGGGTPAGRSSHSVWGQYYSPISSEVSVTYATIFMIWLETPIIDHFPYKYFCWGPTDNTVRSYQRSSGPAGGASDGCGLGRGAAGPDRRCAVRLPRQGHSESSFRTDPSVCPVMLRHRY